jgi:septal ring factor EnvC (AmiA/AmiB activator)
MPLTRARFPVLPRTHAARVAPARQSELQRTRGELSAVQKRVAALQAEKASISAGRAQAALAAEERASRAEAAAEEVRARLAEVHRLTAPATLAHGGSMVRACARVRAFAALAAAHAHA